MSTHTERERGLQRTKIHANIVDDRNDDVHQARVENQPNYRQGTVLGYNFLPVLVCCFSFSSSVEYNISTKVLPLSAQVFPISLRE